MNQVDNLSDKAFTEYIHKKIRNTIRKYKLLKKNDKVGVAVSGGKDSTTCLFVLQKLGYDVKAMTIDSGIGRYSDTNIKNLKKFCKEISIPLDIIYFKKEFGSALPDLLKKVHKDDNKSSACMVCGIFKRTILNRYAKDKGFNAVATGHNLDDEAQAFLMNVFRNDMTRAFRQGPTAGLVSSSSFVRRVKPLYLISEKEVIRYSKIKKFPVYYGLCPYSAKSYRRRFNNILTDFEKDHPCVKYNVVHFQENMAKMNFSEDIDSKEIVLCENCKEPCSGKICKACQILKKIGWK
jgi:tRNA-5-methyluridine54 2-sulfurtransferase